MPERAQETKMQPLHLSMRSAAMSISHLPYPRPQYTRRILNTALSTAYNAPPRSQRRPLSSQTPSTSARLTGRTCMITGGTSGIGFAIANRFLQEGAERIILVGRSYERLLKAATRLQVNDEGARNQEAADETVPKSQGTLVESSDRISLLVGDVSEAGSWLRELEKAMVCYTTFSFFIIWLCYCVWINV